MPPSRTALVLANQGDPIFGALGRLALRGFKGITKLIRGGAKKGGELVRSPQTGELVRQTGSGTFARIAKSKVARVIAEGAGFGTVAGIAGQVVRGNIPGPGSFDGQFTFGQGGCPTGKVVNVAAHQRIIPLDRFGRPRRRIDVLNTKALARATRRLGGFQKRARRVEKQLARIAPRARSRRRSKGVC